MCALHAAGRGARIGRFETARRGDLPLTDVSISAIQIAMARQLALDLPQWGGRREGAGRPRTRPHPGLPGPGVPHLARPELSKHHPVHVTVRLQPGVGYLRTQARAKIIEGAMRAVRGRMRVAHYSIQGNHLHLIVEAADATELSRGMQALAIRIAKRLNALAGRKGGVFVDRYHARALATRREVAHAVRYVLQNYRHHAREYLPSRWEDALSSARFLRCAPDGDAPVAEPRTWLLRVGWRMEPIQKGRINVGGPKSQAAVMLRVDAGPARGSR